MKPRLKSLRFALHILTAVVPTLFGVCIWPGEALVRERHLIPEPVDASMAAPPIRPPAVFFAIDAVLAEHDRQAGRGSHAIRLVSLASTNTASDAMLSIRALPVPIGKGPFGLVTFRAPEDALWRKWRHMEFDLVTEQAVLERCRTGAEDCPFHAARFLRLIDAVKSKSGRAQLAETNRAVNAAVQYVSDLLQHGEADRWSAPLATFAAAKGDCEDYAIAKYVVLQEAGFPRDDLQLLIVRDRATGQDHAVLVAHFDDRWLILDSRGSELIEDIDATTLTPLFAIDHRGVQLFATPYVSVASRGDDIEAMRAAAAIRKFSGNDGLRAR